MLNCCDKTSGSEFHAWAHARRWLGLLLVGLGFLLTTSVQAQPYVNISMGGEFVPGVFGQIGIGNNPPPPVFNPQPVIVGTPVYGAPPIYVHVPDQDRYDWERSCSRYQACGRPVYFVEADERNRWWERHERKRHKKHHDHDDDDDDDDD